MPIPSIENIHASGFNNTHDGARADFKHIRTIIDDRYYLSGVYRITGEVR